jgi:hypothetical protein
MARGNRRKKTGSISPLFPVERAQNGPGKPPQKNGQHFPSFSGRASTKRPGETAAKKRAAFPLTQYLNGTVEVAGGGSMPPLGTA